MGGYGTPNSCEKQLLVSSHLECSIKDFMRLRRTTKHENRVQRAASRTRVSLCYKHPWMAIAWRSGHSLRTQIPHKRLTRAGKGNTTICRTRKREGRMTVSARDLRPSNRLRMEASCKPWWNAVADWMFTRPPSWPAC